MKTMKIQDDTHARLKELKHRGQNLDGFISEMMDKLYPTRDGKGQFRKAK